MSINKTNDEIDKLSTENQNLMKDYDELTASAKNKNEIDLVIIKDLQLENLKLSSELTNLRVDFENSKTDYQSELSSKDNEIHKHLSKISDYEYDITVLKTKIEVSNNYLKEVEDAKAEDVNILEKRILELENTLKAKNESNVLKTQEIDIMKEDIRIFKQIYETSKNHLINRDKLYDDAQPNTILKETRSERFYSRRYAIMSDDK